MARVRQRTDVQQETSKSHLLLSYILAYLSDAVYSKVKDPKEMRVGKTNRLVIPQRAAAKGQPIVVQLHLKFFRCASCRSQPNDRLQSALSQSN